MYSSFGFSQLEVLLVDIPRSGRLPHSSNTNAEVQATNALYYAVESLILFLCAALYLRRVENRRMHIMAAATIPPFVGLLALSLLPNTDAYMWTKWGLYLMTVPYVLSLFIAWTLSELAFVISHHKLANKIVQFNRMSLAERRRQLSRPQRFSDTAWVTCVEVRSSRQ